jgi:hypothetical protein
MTVLLRFLGLGWNSCLLPLTAANHQDPVRSREFDHERRYGALTDIGACRYSERRPYRRDD